MAANIIQHNQDAHTSLSSGINELTNIVKTTLGPRGRNVIIDRPSAGPLITQNGRIITEMLELPDPFMNLGVKVLRDIAVQTGDVTGKGTTTAVVLAQKMIESGFKSIEVGVSSTDLKYGFTDVRKAVISELKSQSNAINTSEEIKQIIDLALNGDSEIADLMVSAFEKVGRDGHVFIDSNDSRESELNIVGGMSFQEGVLNGDTNTLILKDTLILLTNEKIMDSSQIYSILNSVSTANRDLLIISTETDSNFLSWIDRFNSRNPITVYIVEAPGFGNEQKAILQDIAIFTGGVVISKEVGLSLENTTLDDLGVARKIFLSGSSTDIINGYGAQRDVLSRISQIKRQLENATSDDERLALQKRLQNLSSGAAVISVGGGSKEIVSQRIDSTRNALIAVHAAFSEGVVPGGGVAYIRVQRTLNQLRSHRPELSSAIDVVNGALEAPLRSIAENADEDPDTVVKKVQGGSGSFGFNAQSRSYEDLVAAGIIDPAKVLRTAFENALHFSGLVLTTDSCITHQQ